MDTKPFPRIVAVYDEELHYGQYRHNPEIITTVYSEMELQAVKNAFKEDYPDYIVIDLPIEECD